jgi:hypothetical protein
MGTKVRDARMTAAPAAAGALGTILILVRSLRLGNRRDLHGLLGCRNGGHRYSGHDVRMSASCLVQQNRSVIGNKLEKNTNPCGFLWS